MKKLFLAFLLLGLSTMGYAQICDEEVGCDLPFDEMTNAMAHPDNLLTDEPPEECPLDNPECPLPEEFRTLPDSGKALYYLCGSVNPYFRRIGIAFSPNHYRSSLLAYQRCRQASGPFGFFCQRPRCLVFPF